MCILDIPFVILDVETTGLNAKRDRVTEIALLRIEDCKVVAEWQSLINPTIDISDEIFKFTGISNQLVAKAPIFLNTIEILKSYLKGAIVLAHNASFDKGFLVEEFSRADNHFNNDMLCTVELSRVLFPQEKRHNLDSLIDRHGLQVGSRHRAMGDVQLVWQWLTKMKEQIAPEILDKSVEYALKKSNR